MCDKGSSKACAYVGKIFSYKAILSKNTKISLINQKLYFMVLEAAWKAVHLTQILYL